MSRARSFYAIVLIESSIEFLGCGARAPGDAPQQASALGSAPDEGDELGADEEPPQPTLKDVGEKGRRVTVIVKPGDAAVEVNGVAARRRDGVIELVGKEGSPPIILRVFKGLQSREEKVAITAAGASPALVDLYAKPPPVPGGPGGAKKPEGDGDPGLLTDQFQP